jgi:hypothetical protein
MFEVKGDKKIIPIPVIVAVETKWPLPEKLGIKSVQMETERIIDMKDFKMSWVPLPIKL